MRSLEAALERFTHTLRRLESLPDDGGVPSDPVEELRKDLRRVMDRDYWLVFVMVAIVLVVLLGCLLFAWHLRNDVASLAVAIGGSVASLLGFAKVVHGLWQEVGAVRIVLMLIPELPSEQRVAILFQLFERIKLGGSARPSSPQSG